MRDRIYDLAVWMHARRRTILFISNVLLAAGLWCLLVYTMGAEVLKGQQSDQMGTLHDTVVTNTAVIRDHRERIQRLEDTQEKQDMVISQLSQSSVLIQEKMNAMADNQSAITHLLYGVIVALITKILLDLFRSNHQDEHLNHRHGDEPSED